VWAEMQAQVEELTGQAGLQILRAILENEVTHRVGPPHRPNPTAGCVRWGKQQIRPSPILSLLLARVSTSERRMTYRAWPSFGRHTRNHLSTVATVNSEILVGRQDDGVGKRFGHANEASVGEAHGNVGVLLDQLRNRLYIPGKLEGENKGTAAKQLTEARRAALS